MSKDILIASVAVLGWLWAVAQFFLNRRHQRKDKILDRRYEAYAGYLKKSEDMNKGLRLGITNCLGESHDILAKAVAVKSMSEKDAAIALNELFQVAIRNTTEPLLFLTSEIASLKLVCSSDLLSMIEEQKNLQAHLHLEIMSWLPKIDIAEMAELETFVLALYQNPRWIRMAEIDRLMLGQMRKEIGG